LPELSPSLKPEVVTQEFLFTGDPGAMTAARDLVMDFLHEYCANEQEEIDLLLAVQEGLANAVLHGCRNDPGKVVRCAVEVSPETIVISIQDPGEGFDSAGATESTEEGTNLTEHGRGICLMRSLMDEVSYRHHGSAVRLKKRRATTTV